MTDQLDMVAQAKKDGVKRFVPSEFGVDHRITKADFFKPKMEVLEAIEQAKFPDGMSFLLVSIPIVSNSQNQRWNTD